MFGSFIIGYIFAWLHFKNNKESKTEDTIYNAIHIETETPTTIIRAKKTIERGGIEVKYPKV